MVHFAVSYVFGAVFYQRLKTGPTFSPTRQWLCRAEDSWYRVVFKGMGEGVAHTLNPK